MHWPPSQMSGFSSHSSTSGGAGWGAGLQAGRDGGGAPGTLLQGQRPVPGLAGCIWVRKGVFPIPGGGRGPRPPTCTRPPIGHQRVAVSAATPVAALGVKAVHVAPTVPRAAFVHVCGRQSEVGGVAGVRWGSWRGGRQGEVGVWWERGG